MTDLSIPTIAGDTSTGDRPRARLSTISRGLDVYLCAEDVEDRRAVVFRHDGINSGGPMRVYFPNGGDLIEAETSCGGLDNLVVWGSVEDAVVAHRVLRELAAHATADTSLVGGDEYAVAALAVCVEVLARRIDGQVWAITTEWGQILSQHLTHKFADAATFAGNADPDENLDTATAMRLCDTDDVDALELDIVFQPAIDTIPVTGITDLTDPFDSDDPGWRWVVMHDEPQAEDWDITDWSAKDYLALMRSVAVGQRVVISPRWLISETTIGTDPTELDSLEISCESMLDVFGGTYETAVLLRVHLIGPVRGDEHKLEVMVDAVHDLADFYALPGSPERRLLDLLHHGTAAEPNPTGALGQRDSMDVDVPALAGDYPIFDKWKRGITDCMFPHEMLYAIHARGRWTEDWTPQTYAHIAGCFEDELGLPLHPDDPIPIAESVATLPSSQSHEASGGV